MSVVPTPTPSPSLLADAVSLLDHGYVNIPSSARTFAGFCDWKDSIDLPRSVRVSWINGDIEIDMSPEDLSEHNQIKGMIYGTMIPMIKSRNHGIFFTDGTTLLINSPQISKEPDAMYVDWDRFQSGKVSVRRNKKNKPTAVLGPPNWVLEVVSDSSERKDREELKQLYAQAGIDEYWLLDGRGESLRIDILTLKNDVYEPLPMKQDSWYSPVFDCRFQLTRRPSRFGFNSYDLNVLGPDQ